jgi:ABC-type phosphate transport system substrate-binding protein
MKQGQHPLLKRASLAASVVAASVLGLAAAASATPGVGGRSTSTTPTTSTGLSGSAIDTSTVPLDGTGSSFAAPAISTWVNDVQNSPYNLSLVYTSSSSGQGRYEFTNQTADFAVSDIGYVGNTDTQPPSFPFNFIPITAGGIAFMYNVPGLTKTLQLTSYTACALLTGGISNWDNPALATANPGVTLPNLPVVPVTESDSAGTNFVLEEWCIDEQPALWAAFVSQQTSQSGGPTDGVALAATSPNSNWPGISGGLDDQSTTAVAGDIATNPGAIGAVQVKYANDEPGFDGSNPAKSVALVQNASGDFTGPLPVNVASALAYATQLPNGTHKLDFNGIGPHVYNPSTYSYLLTPTTGWSPGKGATMSAFVNYALTLGQQKAPSIGYATLGLSLEQYGINAVTTNVPGSVAPTAAEKAAYSCGDLTPTEVQAGQTTPTCGVVNQTAAPPPPNGGTATGASTTATTSKTVSSTTHAETSATSSSGGSGSGSGVSPFVSLSGTSGLPNTGGNPLPLTILGAALVAVGWVGRRLMLRRKAGSTS